MERMNLEPTAMEQALKNPLVLQEIFRNKAVKGTNLRLVCKLWEEIVLSQPQPKLGLDLDSAIVSDANPLQILCYNMNPKLARSIKLKYASDENYAKLLHVCDKFGDYVQYLDLSVSVAEQFLPTLYLMFQSASLDLMELNIDVEPPYRELPPYFSSLPLLPRPKLRKIKITGFGSNCRQLFQLLVNAAPNLQSLHLDYQCLDLSVNGSLRSLTLQEYVPDESSGSFDELHAMLEQVKDRLEVLELVNDGSLCSEGFEFNAIAKPGLMFKLPVMPKLKHFTNDMIDVYTCGDSLQDIGGHRLMSLRSLTFSKGYNDDRSVDVLLKNVSTCKNLFSGVTTLDISDICDPKLLSTLKIPFPVLQKLIVRAFGNNNPTELGSTLEACSSLGLHHLTVESHWYPKKISDVVKSLVHNCEWFKTLRTLMISCYADGGEDDTSNSDIDAFKQVLTAMAGMERADICYVQFGAEKAEGIQSFIDEMKLPVTMKYHHRS